MLPTIPQAYTWPMAEPVRLTRWSRSTASFATTGLTVPSATDGTKNMTAVQESTRSHHG